MRKVFSRFKSKGEKSPDSGSSTTISVTPTPSSATTETPANLSISPLPPTNTGILSIRKDNSAPEINEHLDATESRPLKTVKPEDLAVPTAVVIQDSLQQPVNNLFLADKGTASEPRFTEASDLARNEGDPPRFSNELAVSGNHTSLEPPGQRASSTPSQEPLPPPIATPQVSSFMLNNQINAGGDSNIYSFVGSLEVNKDTTTRLQKLKTILNPVNAAWDSYEADQRSKCFENTRVQLLSDIKAWVNGIGNQAPIFVLDGVAGIGKTTVAQTIAELAAGLGVLGASFFFTRNEEERATARHFFPTIAFQLARYYPGFAERIAEALENDPDATQKTILQQLSLLIIAPLKELVAQREPPILIVIDALDECKEDEAGTLLTLLTHHAPHMPRLRVFITTRPEWHVRDILSRDGNHKLFRLHEIEDFIVQSDIRLYLNFSLSAERVRMVFPYRRPPWCPSSHDMNMLCGACGTLFIIASTATKFILDKKAQNPGRRLASLLDGVSPTDFSGSKHTNVMDKFYIQIIRSAVPDLPDEAEEWLNLYQLLVGAIIALRNPLSAPALAVVLNIDVSDIESTLLHLHSLVAPNGSKSIYRIHHKSFPDFITNADRIEGALARFSTTTSNLTPKFLIDTRVHHHQLAAACFRIMGERLKFNMANLTPEEWFMDKADIGSLQHELFEQELVYAASHWASHIKAAGEINGGLQEDFRRWARSHVMTWLEVMNILGQINRAHGMLDTALNVLDSDPQGWVEKDRVHRMLSDTRRFLLQSGELVALTPMHIYWSALPFIPQNAPLNKTNGKAKSLSVISGIDREWDPTALVTMTGHSGYVNAVAFSPNGKMLASASRDETICLWDGNTGAHLVTFEGHSGDINDVTFSPDGLRLASASDDRTIRLWDVITGAHLITLEGHSNWVKSIAFAPDGLRLASGSNDRSIRLWDGETGAHLITIKGHSNSINSVAFSPDGLRLASASEDPTVHLWDAQIGAHTTTYEGHSSEVNSVAFSPDGLRLASASDDYTIRLWGATTGALIDAFEGHSGSVFSIVFSPNGLRLASASMDSTVRLWDATTGDTIMTFSGHSSSVLDVAFSPDESRLASVSSDYTVRLWDVKADTLKGHSGNTRLSSNAANIAYASSGHTIYSRDATSDTPELDIVHRHSGEVTAIAHSHSPDGSRFVSGSQDSTLRLWNGQTGAHIITLRGHSQQIIVIAFSPDGSRLASGSYDKTVRLWDGKTGVHICTLDGHLNWIMAIAFSPDGSKLASGSYDTTIRLWDGKTGAHITTLKGHSGCVRAIAFSPDGSRFVSASEDRTFRVWEGRSGSHISTIDSDRVMGPVGFSPTGSTFVCNEYLGNENNTLYLRMINNDVRIISLEKHFKSMASFTFLPSAIHSTFSPPITTTNDVVNPLFTHPVMSKYPLRIIALGRRQNPSLSGLVYLSVPTDGEPVMVPFCWFPPHFNVTAFSVDPAGSSIAVGCENGRVLLLDISKVSLP